MNPVPAQVHARMREDRDYWQDRALEAERRVDALLFVIARQGQLAQRMASRKAASKRLRNRQGQFTTESV